MKKLLIIMFCFVIQYLVFSQENSDNNQYLNEEETYVSSDEHTIINEPYVSNEYKTTKYMDFQFKILKPLDSIYKINSNEFVWTIKPMPKGASFKKQTCEFSWTPDVDQTGYYNIFVKIKYKDQSDSMNLKFTVVEEWESSFLPGISFVYYQPTNKPKYGTFYGPSVEYLLYSWIHRNENRGPSHGKYYLKLELLSSSQDTIKESFFYSMGLNMSLERNAQRNYLIPYYGIEIGGFYHNLTNNIFYLAPLAGIWIYSSQNFFVTADVKYQFPTDNFDELKGVRGNIGFNFSMW